MSAAPARAPIAALPVAVGREQGIAEVAFGLIGLRVVDDAFLQPQPGSCAT
jgi:hypothetical protein